jgi:hypothetical protein
MAGMNLGGGFAAGQGADALMELMKQAALEQEAKARTAQEGQRIGLEQQRVTNETAYRNLTLADAKAKAEADQRDREATAIKGSLSMLPIGATVDPTVAAKARAFGLPVQHEAADLPSVSMAGGAQATPTAPMMGSLRMMQTGTPERDVWQGSAEQQKKEADDKQLQAMLTDPSIPQNVRDFLKIRAVVPGGAVPSDLFKPPEHSASYKEYQDAVASGYKGDFNKYQNEDANRKRTAPAMVTVQTVDANGNAVTKIVPKTAGDEYAKPANATTANRVASAEAVNKVGNDLISKLSDPKIAATLGPVMGRASSLQDFIGNPPPEYSELAGEIESYALANMGVHGMRSAQGAEQIKKLLEGKHTPESLIATIKGLNNFSNAFVAGNKPKAGSAAASGGGGGTSESPDHRFWRLNGGQGPEPK